MSETTEILFNSPALHSLKREQLQKLCKIHSIKANGKNSDLIDRLRQRALTLPNDDPLSIAARSEPHAFPLIHSSPSRAPEDDDEELGRLSRPSEQWEIVMESIQEVEEMSSQGTLSSLRTLQNSTSGEFGTAGSKRTITILISHMSIFNLFLPHSINSRFFYQGICKLSGPYAKQIHKPYRFIPWQRRHARSR